MKDFTELPGCALWLEVNESGVVNKLKELGLSEGDVFVWEDPNKPEQGTIVAYGRQLTEKERDDVQALLAERSNPSPSEMQ